MAPWSRGEPDPIAWDAAQVLAKHAKSFRYASWFLPRSMRRDASIVYAFCRLVDDAVDDAPNVPTARMQLTLIEDMLHGRAPRSPLVLEYCNLADRLGFGLGPAMALMAGAASDLAQVRIEGDAELLTYCYRMAGTVGQMMCGVLGVKSQEAVAHGVALGVAMQLTNICRDVREDALLGRVYLPRKRLLDHGLTAQETEPSSLLAADEQGRRAVSRVVLQLLADSERTYALAEPGMKEIPARPRLAITVAARLYRAIGERLSARGGDALRGRTIVPVWQKAALIVACVARWIADQALPKPARPLLRPGPSSLRVTDFSSP